MTTNNSGPRVAVAVVAAIAAGITAPAPALAGAALRFHSTQYDSPGKDTRTNASLNAEWIVLVNTGSASVNLSRWAIIDKSATYTIGNVTVPGNGGKIWLHTGKGTDTRTHLYWGRGNYVWNNTGDTATLRTPSGEVQDTCTWKQQTGRTTVAC